MPDQHTDPRIDGRLAGLNPKQAEAVATLDGPLLVVAGPGSGKTRVLTHRLAALIDTGVRPANILAVTFTNKAAAEMRERLAVLLPDMDRDALGRMWVSTFHAACARMLRYEGQAVGLDKRFTIADTGVARRVLRTTLAGENRDVDDDLVKSAASAISRAKNRLLSPEEMERSTDLGLRAWASAAAAYQKSLTDQGLVDFDDLLVKAVQLLGVPEQRQMWRDRFTHLLVDEFQDTNLTQYEFVSRLGAGHRQVCVVGDRQQAIYGWRGAQPELMRRFTDDFAPTSVVTLDQNYRSTRAIVDVSAALVAPLADGQLAHADLWTENDAGEPVEWVRCADDRDEADFVVNKIEEDRAYDDHAILFRTNAQTNLFEQGFATRGIPYRLVGATRFYDRAEVRDALAWLQAVANPDNGEAFRRMVARPKRGIGAKSVDMISERAAEAEMGPLRWLQTADLEELPTRLRAPAQGLLDDVARITQLADEGPEEALRCVLGDIGLIDSFKSPTDPRAEEREENLAELVAAAARFEYDRPEAGLVEFLEYVALATSADDDGDEGVWLITAHAAKGREFPVVWVVGVEDGFFPHARSREAHQIDEERRLLFVAASRAMSKLTLTTAASRFLYGSVQTRSPSPFCDDFPPAVVTRYTSNARSAEGLASHRTLGARPTGRVGKSTRASAHRQPAARGGTFAVGETVEHPRFGKGMVAGLDGDRVSVRFDDTTRVLSATYAPMVHAS